MTEKKKLGIIGGMGPLATAELFRLIVEMTDSADDAGHIRIFIDNNTSVPDRTRAIRGLGPSPVPAILESARGLVSLGAQILLIPCNASHCFYDEIAAGTDAVVLNMPELTAQELADRGIKKAGLLAAEGTVLGGIYQKYLSLRGIETVIPDADGQRAVTGLIYDGVKAGRADHDAHAFQAVLDDMYARGAETVILGCTELMPGIRMYGIRTGSTVEPMKVLARAAITGCGYTVKDT